jgi:hypothetical protein
MKTYSKRDNGVDVRPPAKKRRVEGAYEAPSFVIPADKGASGPGTEQSSSQTGRDDFKFTRSENPTKSLYTKSNSGAPPHSSRSPLSYDHPSSGNKVSLLANTLGGKDGCVKALTTSKMPVSLSKSASVPTPTLTKHDPVRLIPETRFSSSKANPATLKTNHFLGIKSYFKPLSQRSSSPPLSVKRSLDSSDSNSVTPPSSPPPLFSDENESFEICQKPRRRPQRRLITRPRMRSPLDKLAHSPEKTDIGINQSQIAHSPTSMAIDESSRSVTKPKRKNSQKLQQTHLDLGQISEIVCKNCEMVYNSAVESDRRDHELYCYSHRCPLLTKEEGRRKNEFVWEKMTQGIHHHIRMITCTSGDASKETAMRIINYVYTELPGLGYSPEELWGGSVREQRNHANSVPVGPFKMFIYYVGTEVAGVLLAEGYKEGMVVQLEGLPIGQKFVVIDRIWVREKHRRKGFASVLADVVRQKFMCGVEIKKSGVATSDLTLGFGVPWVKGYFGK